MPFCRSCGAELTGEEKFCNQCGESQSGEVPEISWTGKVSMVHNPQVYRVYFHILVISGIIGFLLSAYMGNFTIFLLLTIISIAIIILFILASILMEWVTGGGPAIQGFVNEEGVAHQAGEGTGTMNRGSLIAGLLAVLGGAGSGWTLLGGGILSSSQENNAISWNQVNSVHVYPRQRIVFLRDATYINGVVLYCTEENFERVLAVIQKKIPAHVKIS